MHLNIRWKPAPAYKTFGQTSTDMKRQKNKGRAHYGPDHNRKARRKEIKGKERNGMEWR